MHIAIIGAGMAGLSCARHLAAEGHEVTLFDKGRGPGGRLSGRRHDLGAIDHGAQYFTVRDPSFQAQVQAWLDAGIVAPWSGHFVEDRPEGLITATSERFIGTPRMNRCIRDLAEQFTVHWKTRIAAIHRAQGEVECWQLSDTDGASHGPFSAVVLAIPPIQAAELLGDYPAFEQEVSACSADPCWALMLWCAEGQQPERQWDAWSSSTHPSLGWVSWEQSKPERGSTPACSPMPMSLGQPSMSTGSRHRSSRPCCQTYAISLNLTLRIPQTFKPTAGVMLKTAQAMGKPALYDSQLGLGICGDWCLDGRIEAAWISGRELAQRMLG